MSSTFHIIYPSGDRSKLKVLELSFSESHELDEYAVASRQYFVERANAEEYARELAAKHNKVFVPDSKEHDYLD